MTTSKERRGEVEEVAREECSIEIIWRQHTPETWVALVKNSRTGATLKVHSEQELLEALRGLCREVVR